MDTYHFDDIDYWKAIILYGLNQATYKIALGKTLLQLSHAGKNTVDWNTLARTFLNNYIERLKTNPMPQQTNPARRTVMERINQQLLLGTITYEGAVERVETDGFNDVVPRFHTIGLDTKLAAGAFYQFEHGKRLYIKDSLFKINETHGDELYSELEARWSLLEGAFTLNHGNWELANDIRDIYLFQGYERRLPITRNIPFLKGYQGNVCFYCGEEISNDDIHVDHVLPRQLMMHDEVWNLVLSHSLCNMSKEDALVGPHYVEKLIARNENIMGSNHPWKKKISSALGAIREARIRTTRYHYENAKVALHGRYWENCPNYNRETDPFYKKLITYLNNT